MRLNVKTLTLTSGLIWGLGLFALTWWIILLQGKRRAEKVDTLFNHVYPGYKVTPTGSIFGLIWGFLDGAMGGLTFGCLYNALLPKKHKDIPQKLSETAKIWTE